MLKHLEFWPSELISFLASKLFKTNENHWLFELSLSYQSILPGLLEPTNCSEDFKEVTSFQK
jgi:hypothetical protein